MCNLMPRGRKVCRLNPVELKGKNSSAGLVSCTNFSHLRKFSGFLCCSFLVMVLLGGGVFSTAFCLFVYFLEWDLGWQGGWVFNKLQNIEEHKGNAIAYYCNTQVVMSHTILLLFKTIHLKPGETIHLKAFHLVSFSS